MHAYFRMDMAASQSLMNQYPSISDLAEQAKKRIPHVAWDYLYAGTGKGEAAQRNLEQFSDIILTPEFVKGKFV